MVLSLLDHVTNMVDSIEHIQTEYIEPNISENKYRDDVIVNMAINVEYLTALKDLEL